MREDRGGEPEVADGARMPHDRMWSRVEMLRVALAGRGRFPQCRVQEFRGLSDTDLRAAVENTRAVHERLSRLLAGHEVTRGQALDLALFTCDHRWRSIAAGLTRLGPTLDGEVAECWALALRTYLDYLGSREATLRALLRARPRDGARGS
jgi:hypothetical protein